MFNKKSNNKIIIVIICISFCQGLQFAISPVLNQIQAHYPEVNVSLIQMLITIPTFPAMIVAIISGWLVVKISKKKLLILGSFITGIAGFIPLLSDSFILLFFSRIFFGIGLGLVSALNTAVVAEHFTGKERVTAMGIQGASIGGGIFVETTLSGIIGIYGYRYTFYIHIIGILATILIGILLPDTGKAIITKTEKIQLNKEVYKISFLGMLEFIFLISFTTNIAMHLAGKYAGNSSAIGILTGIYAIVQIIIGLILGKITKYTKDNTFSLAMLSFGIGSIILALFPTNYPMLLMGTIFCGFSQGLFAPQAMYYVANSVNPASTTMASAVLTVAMCTGQLISPTILNSMSRIIFKNVTTVNVFLISALSMFIISMFVIISNRRQQKF